jgi:hypothetical protein
MSDLWRSSYTLLKAPSKAGGEVGRLLLVIAVVLILALVLGGTGALEDAAYIIVQILRVLFSLLVRLIDLFVDLLKSLG